MHKILIFFAGASAGFCLCGLSSADLLVGIVLAVILLMLLVLAYLFHLGISDFQEYER